MNQISAHPRNLLICVSLVVLIVAVYWPVGHFQFINYDDYEYVYRNAEVQKGLTAEGFAWAFTTTHAANWHPLTWLSHMLDCQLFGLKPGAHHLVSLLFHIVNTLLLFGLLSRMTGAAWRSAFVAALFAIHPLHVESVAWVAERKDVLSTFFWMLTLWAYVRYMENCRSGLPAAIVLPRGSGVPAATGACAAGPAPSGAGDGLYNASRSAPTRCHCFYALALLFFAFGLMAKPMLVTLPLVLLLLDYWPLGRTRWCEGICRARTSRSEQDFAPKISLARLLLEKLPFFVLALASCVTTVWAQHAGEAVVSLQTWPVGMRLSNVLVAYVRYIGKMFWPVDLAVFYPHQVWPLLTVCGAGVVLLGISGVAIRRGRQEPYWATGWLWYLITLVPVIGVMQVGSQSIADRYTYIPLIGLFIIVAWAVPGDVLKPPVRKLTAAITAAVLLAACAVLCRLQVGYWKNSETLFRHALKVTTSNWLAHYNLGEAVAHAGNVPEALEHFQQAVRIMPSYAEAQHNLGITLWQMDKVPDAIEHYEQALRINPGYAAAHYNLALALWRVGQRSEAIAHWQRALELKPDYAEANNNLGLALMQTGQVPEAISHYERALRIKPDYMEAHYNLGMALWRTSKLPEAIGHFEEALRLKPDAAEVHYYLGIALEQAGQRQKTMDHYEQALRIKPDYVEALNNLAWLLATLPTAEGGDPARAVKLAERACQLTGSKQATYLDTLGVAYAAAGRFEEAITAAQKAIELARAAGQPPQAVKEIEERVQWYREGHAYR